MGVVPLEENDVEILAAEPCSEPPHEQDLQPNRQRLLSASSFARSV
jgi:hypothetical protein